MCYENNMNLINDIFNAVWMLSNKSEMRLTKQGKLATFFEFLENFFHLFR